MPPVETRSPSPHLINPAPKSAHQDKTVTARRIRNIQNWHTPDAELPVRYIDLKTQSASPSYERATACPRFMARTPFKALTRRTPCMRSQPPSTKAENSESISPRPDARRGAQPKQTSCIAIYKEESIAFPHQAALDTIPPRQPRNQGEDTQQSEPKHEATHLSAAPKKTISTLLHPCRNAHSPTHQEQIDVVISEHRSPLAPTRPMPSA